MRIRAIAFVTTLLVACASLGQASALAARKGVPPQQPSEKHVFTDRSEYDSAVSALKSRKANEIVKAAAMSKEEKEARAAEVQKALDQVDPGNPDDLERTAKKLGLVIYSSGKPASSGDVSIQSDGCCDVDFSMPSTGYDPIVDSSWITGEVRWTDSAGLSGDLGFSTSVGKQDGAGLWFTSMNQADIDRIWSRSFTTYDYGGREHLSGSNPEFSPLQGEGQSYAVVFRAQDTYTNSWRDYNFWRVVTYVWFDHNAPSQGSVYMIYAHTWAYTEFTGVTFSAGGSLDDEVFKPEGSITFQFSKMTDHWTVGSLSLPL